MAGSSKNWSRLKLLPVMQPTIVGKLVVNIVPSTEVAGARDPPTEHPSGPACTMQPSLGAHVNAAAVERQFEHMTGTH